MSGIDPPLRQPSHSVPSEAPEAPVRSEAASRVPVALRRGGIVIALSQAALPVASIWTDPDVPVSLPLLALAAGMMGIGGAITRDRKRQDDS